MIHSITEFLKVTGRLNNNRQGHWEKYNKESNLIKEKSKDDDKLQSKREKCLQQKKKEIYYIGQIEKV